MLTKKCITILQNKLPPKLRDQKSFTIPYTIRNYYFEKSLYGLGVNVNLMF